MQRPNEHITNDIDIHKFLQQTNVESIITEIENHWAKNGKPIYSDLYKEEDGKTYEYVNYVQEGGGVLGVALVGYTYVLERLGFRFLKLAGTSAGAINTLLMAAVNTNNYEGKNYKYRSEMILDEMLRFDFWKLVDGHWFAKWLIQLFISKNTNYKRLKGFLMFCVLGTVLYAIFFGLHSLYEFRLIQNFIAGEYYPWFFGAGVAATAYLGFTWRSEIVKKKKEVLQQQNELEPKLKTRKAPNGWVKLLWVFVFALSVATLAQVLCYYVFQQLIYRFIPGSENFLLTLLQIVGSASVLGLLAIIFAYLYFKGRFSRAGFGINPGDEFSAWMEKILARNKISTSEELNQIIEHQLANENLQLRPDARRHPDQNNTQIPQPYYSIMASDITLGTKAEFPSNAKDYWPNPAQANPACFVRASMSIPVFFSPFKIKVPQSIQDRSRLWHQKGTAQDYSNDLKKEIWFVDGGVLSNFPINIFHDPKKLRARMPTFGVKLEDEKHQTEEEGTQPSSIKFGSFLGKIFSTIRFYYDKDFLSRNAIYEKGIAHIDVENINWLDFGMKEEVKIDLFNRGAMAAKTFFMGGEYWVDGKKHDTRMVAKNDEMGKEFINGFNWEAWKNYRQIAIEKDLKAHLNQGHPGTASAE